MKADQKIATHWLNELSLTLPGLDEILTESSADILIIGASVFGIYAKHGWIPPLKRRTGDLDPLSPEDDQLAGLLAGRLNLTKDLQRKLEKILNCDLPAGIAA